MHVQPYLSFEGKCDEALEFYKKALDAEVGFLMRFKDSPEGACAAGQEDKIMHCEIKVGDTTLMASDGMCAGPSEFKGIALALTTADDAEAEQRFNALAADGGTIQMPLTRTFFSSSFGMVQDKFGVAWMIVVAGEPA